MAVVRRRKTLAERFHEKYEVDARGCWIWTASRTAEGYGKLADGEGRWKRAHRIAYELFVGPVSEGLEIDHLCGQPSCVNPEHLEAVTHRVNLLRGGSFAAKNDAATHCPHGHPYDAENTYRGAKGERICLACKRQRGRDYMRRKRASRGSNSVPRG